MVKMHLRYQPRHVAVLAAAVTHATAQSCVPQMFFVNYMNTPDQMHVGWTTACSTPDATVQYGLSPSALSSSAPANNTQYQFADGLYTSPYLHHAFLSGLPAASTVYYKVGGSASGYSAVMNFTTHPGVGPNIPLRFAVIGDLGQTNNSADTLNHVVAGGAPSTYTAMLHAGDLSYADSYEPRWDSWQTLIAPVSQSLPWMTVPGNHEIEPDINLATFEAYKARFPMPLLYPGTPQQRSDLYYSWKVGGVHFIMLNSYSDYSNSSAQYAWLAQEVTTIDRSVTPFVIAILHAPWYNSNTAHQGEGEAMRQSMEGLIFNAGVDLVFAGHVHAYERNYRVFNNAPNPAGPYYITIGDGGNREGLASNWISPQPAISAFRQASYGHGQLEVVNATHMHWSWHQNPDLEPTIADELWIVAQHAGGKGMHTQAPAHALPKGVTAQPHFRAANANAALFGA